MSKALFMRLHENVENLRIFGINYTKLVKKLEYSL